MNERLIDANHFKERAMPKCAYPKSLEEEVDAEPTVDAALVKHGHWEWTCTYKHRVLGMFGEIYTYTPVFVCSECHLPYESYERGDEPMEEDADYPEYCHRCGARMDGKNVKIERNEDWDGTLEL